MGIVETVKDIAELIQKSDNVDLMRKLATLQQEAVDSIERERKLRDRIQELEDQHRIEGELEFRRNAYWRGDAAYCTACWDQKKTLARLHDQKNGERWKCPGCGWSDYQGQEGRDLENRRIGALQGEASAQSDWDPLGR